MFDSEQTGSQSFPTVPTSRWFAQIAQIAQIAQRAGAPVFDLACQLANQEVPADASSEADLSLGRAREQQWQPHAGQGQGCPGGAMMSVRWQRVLWLLLWLLSPLLWLQARHVRRITPRMPEPPGQRAGTAGRGPIVRLLVAGDSGAAGVGALKQDEALCGQLVQRLSRHHTVEWCVLAVNGLDSPGLLKLLQDAPCARFDVVVLSIGANDATGLCAPLHWARWQARLAEFIALRFAPTLLVHSAVPPMHACMALPQPLRWFMGHWAKQMNQSLAGLLIDQVGRTMHWHPETTTREGMAVDGIHPSSAGYAAWADDLSRCILTARSPDTTLSA